MDSSNDSKLLLACGHYPSPHGEWTTGTCILGDGTEICWECGYKQELEFLRLKKPSLVYLNSDCSKITTWPGYLLGDVVRKVRLLNLSRRYGYLIWAIVVRDTQGVYWYGRGSGECALVIRPYANQKGVRV